MFPLNMDVLSSTSQNAWQEWDAAHTRQPPKAGGPILPVKNQCKVYMFPLSMDVLSSAPQNAWQEWDAAHTRQPPKAGGPILPVKSKLKVGMIHLNMDVLSSAAIIPGKILPNPQSAHARVHVKTIPNTLCLQAFQHKNIKNQMLVH